ncbi:LTA synthase family protein [Gorillibacterium massiliense]|uniref:LTA synthase family protein n=1 Tax=Gorillibacterium massiliense TaxID=1280390 RepID=UPI0004B0BB2A|nr:LTA synthase family protein [Gorillibacterium massiliense]
MSLLPNAQSIRSFITKPFVFFSLLLLFKSFLAWAVIFENGMAWRTLITEIPFVWIIFCFVEWFSSRHKLVIYQGVNLALTGLLFAVIMYYKYYGVVVTYHALQQVNQVTAVSNSVFSLLQPYYLLIFTDVLVLGYFFLRGKRRKAWKRHGAIKVKRSVVMTLFIFSLAVCLFNILPNRASMSEIKKAEGMGIFGYEAYTILSDEKPEDLVPVSEISQPVIDNLKKGSGSGQQNGEHFGIDAGKNLIIIQLESFQNFLIGLTVDGMEITPTMNKLAKEGLYFPNFYHQVGQGNTSDAEFIVNTSYYIPYRGAATGSYAYKKLPSLPKLLKENGYTTSTFHTNIVEFWNRGELYDALGFDRYYDKAFFGSSDEVFFGASDDVLYAKTLEELKTKEQSSQPFYSQIISMTAHHPFTIPEDKKLLKLPKSYDNTLVGDYIQAQHYADHALGQFIEGLKENRMWDDSLIVIYGDHMGLPIYSLEHDDKKLMEDALGHEYSYPDMMNIPLMILSSGVPPQTVEQTGGQVDVLPTVANLLGVSLEGHLHFGQDILNEKHNVLPERYYLPTGSFIGDDAVFIPGVAFEDGTSYPLKITNDGAEALQSDYEAALRLLKLSDSYVRRLPDRGKNPNAQSVEKNESPAD